MADYNTYKNIGNSSNVAEQPIQTLPFKMKNKKWLEANMDFFYNEAVKQKRRNLVFSKIREMTKGNFIYESVDIEKTLYGDEAQQLKKLTNDVPLPTHLKHFDFLGIMANAIEAVFSELDDKYRVISVDEYSDNDYIRARTENLHKYAEKIFQLEIEKRLIQNGLNPNITEFNSEEEKQQYIQKIQAEAESYRPDEYEKVLSSNFKVLATDWANNVLLRDKEKFYLDTEDRERLVDYILTGRWFRHYRVGYDYYDIEDWIPEEVFFSQDIDTKFPQKCSYIGRLTNMSITNVLSKYGHLMNIKQQEEIGDFFNKGKDYKKGFSPYGVGDDKNKLPFATNYILPFYNYFDHEINLKMEDYLGVPLGRTLNEDGSVGVEYTPRLGNIGSNPSSFYSNYRSDIVVSDSNVEVMELYWTSFELNGVLIYRNEIGALDIIEVKDSLIKEFIKDNNIKINRKLTLEELQTALREDRLEEYENTIYWHYLPQSWYAVVLKNKGSLKVEDDIILWGKPTLQQIKGNSDYYEVLHPVGGIISDSKIKKAFPYQQLHNVCLNQISELIADEPGIFYSFDINALPDDIKEDQTTEEALFTMLDNIKLTKLAGFDLSRQSLKGGTVYPNIFQRNEIVFADMVKYRRELAEFFKSEGYAQLGVTPQLLGAPINFETAEGQKQNATATYALINNLLDDFTSSKARSNELHVAIAQICETNGKSSSRLIQNSDGANIFIDILSEDKDYFPFRRLSVLPAASSKDRPVVKILQNMLLSDNTIQKDLNDLVDIFTNPHALKIKQIAKQMRIRQDQKDSAEKQFQTEQLDKQLENERRVLEEERQHQINIANIKGQWGYKEAYLTALGRDSASTTDDNISDITKAYELNLKESTIQQDGQIKMQELNRRIEMDEATKKIELEKLKQKNRELQLKREQMVNNRYIATVNKN